MRILNKVSLGAIDAEQGIGLVATDPEDMWHANNLIAVGDTVKAHAIRGIAVTTATTNRVVPRRVHTELTIKVTKTFFDPGASSLHVSGTVVTENEYVSIGQYHTLDLELHRPFTLWKAAGWDSVALQTLQEAANDDKTGALVAIVMHEGLANICLITDHRTIIKQRVEHSVPKKRATTKESEGGLAAFYAKTLETLLRAVDFGTPRPLLLASPGFVAQDFKAYIEDRGARTGDKMMMRMARDAVVVHTSTGYVHSLNEVLKSPEVKATMHDKKYTSETTLVDRLCERVRKDDGRAWYGLKPVTKAVAEGAVGRGGGVLLINNSIFRSMDIPTRKKYVALVDKVKADGGEAKILSSDHESGQRLDALGGIAAILTYPIFDLDEDTDDEDEDAAEVEDETGAAAII